MNKTWQAVLKHRNFSIYPKVYYLPKQSKKPPRSVGHNWWKEAPFASMQSRKCSQTTAAISKGSGMSKYHEDGYGNGLIAQILSHPCLFGDFIPSLLFFLPSFLPSAFFFSNFNGDWARQREERGKGKKLVGGAEVNFLMNLSTGKDALEKTGRWQFKGNFKSQLKHFPTLSPVTLLNAFSNSAFLSLVFIAGK